MTVRYGLIGCGKIYTTHADALQKISGAILAGVYDSNPEAARDAGDRYGVPAASSIEGLFDLVDAVIVAIPSGHHAEVGVLAAAAGKHIVMEKPIDVTLEAATLLVETARRHGVKLTCISQHRFAQDIRRLKDAIDDGHFGEVLQGDAYVKWYRTQAYYDSGEWRGTYRLDGGGCLMNQGVHYVDMIQWVMGGVRSVQALCRTKAHRIEVEDVAYALVEYNSGAIGMIHASTCCYPGLAERLEVHGRNGSAILEGDRVKLWNLDPVASQEGQYGGGVQMQPTPNIHLSSIKPSANDAEVERSGPATGLLPGSWEWGEQHRLQLEDFTEAILNDREPFITGEMALAPLRIILAIYTSSRNGGARTDI